MRRPVRKWFRSITMEERQGRYSRPEQDVRFEVCEKEEANLIGSITVNDLHAPVLDFDFPCRLIESGTPGHYHLYIDQEIEWSLYEPILTALFNAGLINPMWYENSILRHCTAVRPPWKKKTEEEKEAEKEWKRETRVRPAQPVEDVPPFDD